MSKNNKVVNILLTAIIIVAATIIVFLIIADTTTSNTAHQQTHVHGHETDQIIQPESDDIISRNGIHYHPKLDIYIKGQLQTIPAGVGLEPVEKPIHTHDTTNIIHMEFSGLVNLDNTRLQEFFKIWGKQFNSNCIFDNCNGQNGTVKIFVNGQPNNEFEKYPMKDDDKIEIRYE